MKSIIKNVSVSKVNELGEKIVSVDYIQPSQVITISTKWDFFEMERKDVPALIAILQSVNSQVKS